MYNFPNFPKSSQFSRRYDPSGDTFLRSYRSLVVLRSWAPGVGCWVLFDLGRWLVHSVGPSSRRYLSRHRRGLSVQLRYWGLHYHDRPLQKSTFNPNLLQYSISGVPPYSQEHSSLYVVTTKRNNTLLCYLSIGRCSVLLPGVTLNWYYRETST